MIDLIMSWFVARFEWRSRLSTDNRMHWSEVSMYESAMHADVYDELMQRYNLYYRIQETLKEGQ